MKITFNVSFVLWLLFLMCGVFAIDLFLGLSLTREFFSISYSFRADSVVSYARLFLHVIGHASPEHLYGNFFTILLVGPIVNEKYGSVMLLLLSSLVALVTALTYMFLFAEGIMGASGIAFMFIFMASFANARRGELPVTLILAVCVFGGMEVFRAFRADHVAQLAHLIGGAIGAIFAYLFAKPRVG